MKTNRKIGLLLLIAGIALFIIFLFGNFSIQTVKILSLLSIAALVSSLVFGLKCSTRYLKFIKNMLIVISGKLTYVEIYEQKKDGKLKQMFDSISTNTEKLCIEELNAFVNEDNRDEAIKASVNEHILLLKTGWNLLLFKHGKKFFVAHVRVDGGGSLEVVVVRLEYAFVYYASDRLRVVVPQLVS